MSIFHATWSKLLTVKLGYCSKCTRKAFQTATTAWAFTAVAVVFDLPRVAMSLCVIATVLSFLWIAHIIAYARKKTKATRNNEANSTTIKPTVITSSRRELFPLFARILAGAALGSVIATPAFADSACGGFNGECKPCARRNDANSPCEWCHSCGANCPQDNNC
jgi:hypothetical protein